MSERRVRIRGRHLPVAAVTMAGIAFLSACGGESRNSAPPPRSEAKTAELTGLLPLDSGRTWTYRLTGGGGASQVQIVRVARLLPFEGDRSCALLESFTEGSSPTVLRECLAADSVGIVRMRVDSALHVTLDSAAHYLLKAPLSAATTWDWTGSFPGVGEAVVEYTALGPEEVVIPAGQYTAEKVEQRVFSEAAHLAGKLMLSSGSVTVTVEPYALSTRWYVAGVGVVREEIRIGKIVHLTAELTAPTR